MSTTAHHDHDTSAETATVMRRMAGVLAVLIGAMLGLILLANVIA